MPWQYCFKVNIMLLNISLDLSNKYNLSFVTNMDRNKLCFFFLQPCHLKPREPCMASVSYVCMFYFNFWYTVWAHCDMSLWYLRYSDSYKKHKLWQIITYEDDFMKGKIYIALNCETHIITQFKSILTY